MPKIEKIMQQIEKQSEFTSSEKNSTKNRIKDNLIQTAENMLRLSDRLSDTGKPLTDKDIDLIRIANFYNIKEHLKELEIFYLTGNTRHTKKVLDTLHDITNITDIVGRD